jgi:hypothetical protein
LPFLVVVFTLDEWNALINTQQHRWFRRKKRESEWCSRHGGETAFERYEQESITYNYFFSQNSTNRSAGFPYRHLALHR